MKLSLVTTTINVPQALQLYRAYDPEVPFFITGDQKSPHQEIRSFVKGMANARYYDVEQQKALNYRCSELIGWSCIQRRNIAVLEAIRSGAEVIVTVDDDNLPLSRAYFGEWSWLFSKPWAGLQITSLTGEFDVGQLIIPASKHRGAYRHTVSPHQISLSPVTDVRVGIAAGVCLGDPDIDATDRLVARPEVHTYSTLLDTGVVLDPDCHSVWNSQNTAYRRELAPLMFCLPGVGRYDDIFGAIIALRVLEPTHFRVHFGRPFVWQQRNAHDLVADIAAEMYGMTMLEKFVSEVHRIDITGFSLTGRLRKLYGGLGECEWFPKQARDAGLAWCDDCDAALSGEPTRRIYPVSNV